jgi:Flp pilus assembly protein TadD
VAIAVLLAITIVALVNYRRRPWLVVGWLWFLGVLAPVCGIFQAGPQLLADRFSYLPSVGLVVMVVFSIPAAISTAAQLRLRIGLTVVMLAIFCSGSWLQSRYWLSTFTLFSRAQEVTKDNWLAYDQLGLVAYRNGNMDLAEGYCRRSLRLNEIDPVANYNLGIALARKGQFKSAIPFYQASMVLQPDSPEAHVMLGVALEQTGDLQGAYANYERATEIAPEYASAHGAMGVILARIGLSDKAVAELRTALKLQPSDEKLRAKYFAAVAMAKQKSQPSVAGAAEAGQ